MPIPAADGSGRIVDIYGKKIGQGLRPTAEVHTHLNGDRLGAFNVEAFGAVEEVVLCTSVFDALTFWSSGFRNVTAMFGSDALTTDLLGAFEEFGIRRVLTTSEKVVEKLLAAGLEAFLIRLPAGLDVNAFALQTSDPADALGSLIRGAEWAGKGQPPATPVPVTPASEADVTLADLLDADDEELDALDELDEADGVGEELEPAPSPAPEPPVRIASPVPPVPPQDEAAVTETEVVLTFGTRRYRVRGLSKNATPDVLKVNILASNGVGMHVDSIDLYSAKHRAGFVEQAAAELNVEPGTVKHDLGRVLLKLEEVQDARFKQAERVKPAHPEMTAAERDEALAMLRDPKLLDKIVNDFNVVGDRTNKLVGYLAAVSRKLDTPLAVLIQSTSAAGKTTLMESVLNFCPPEDVVKFSAMTGQSLYYMPEGGLKHRILAIVEEEGAARASYALKLLQSEGELRIASTGKEVSSGRLTAQEYRVEGPTMLFLTTTSIQVDEELQNRCLVLTVHEDREQTRAIHDLQRKRQTLDGLPRRQQPPQDAGASPQRPAAPEAAPGRQPLRRAVDVPDHEDTHPPGPPEVPHADPHHHAAPPAPAARPHGRTRRPPGRVHRSDPGRHRGGEPAGRGSPEPVPGRPAAADEEPARPARRLRERTVPGSECGPCRLPVQPPAGAGGDGLGRHAVEDSPEAAGRPRIPGAFFHRDREAKRHLYELLYTTNDSDRALPGLPDVADLRP